jgi:transposase-like protein
LQANHCRALDGLKGFPDAINAAFPNTTVQTCIVHLVRHSLNFCGWKDRKNVAKDLKRSYQATDDVEAEKALANFEAGRGQNTPQSHPHGGGHGRKSFPS